MDAMAGRRQPVSPLALHWTSSSASVANVVTNFSLVYLTLRCPCGFEESQAACVSIGGCPEDIIMLGTCHLCSLFITWGGRHPVSLSLFLSSCRPLVRDLFRKGGFINLGCRDESQAACVSLRSTLGLLYWSILSDKSERRSFLLSLFFLFVVSNLRESQAACVSR